VVTTAGTALLRKLQLELLVAKRVPFALPEKALEQVALREGLLLPASTTTARIGGLRCEMPQDTHRHETWSCRLGETCNARYRLSPWPLTPSPITEPYPTMPRLLVLLALIAMPLFSHAVEEPKYQVIRQFDNVELRQYAPYVVAEVVLDATADEAGRRAFPILAGYIFGKNKGEKKFAMTAPVMQSAAPVKLELTAPVTQAAVSGGMSVQFVLPEGVTLESAPEPLDPRVRVHLVPATQWATIRYSGTWSQANYDEHLAKLQTALAAAGVATQGRPVFARYNGPMTPWFLRRNEIWLALR